MAINDRLGFCDDGHQAIAFLGTCPMCRELHIYPLKHVSNPIPPPDQGAFTFVADLKRAIAAAVSDPLRAIAEGAPGGR